MKKDSSSKFEKAAANKSVGFFREWWNFIKTNKKWWLLPIVIVLLIFSILILLSSTGVAPFIYTLF